MITCTPAAHPPPVLRIDTVAPETSLCSCMTLHIPGRHSCLPVHLAGSCHLERSRIGTTANISGDWYLPGLALSARWPRPSRLLGTTVGPGGHLASQWPVRCASQSELQTPRELDWAGEVRRSEHTGGSAPDDQHGSTVSFERLLQCCRRPLRWHHSPAPGAIAHAHRRGAAGVRAVRTSQSATTHVNICRREAGCGLPW
jgi:hypothetical protein